MIKVAASDTACASKYGDDASLSDGSLTFMGPTMTLIVAMLTFLATDNMSLTHLEIIHAYFNRKELDSDTPGLLRVPGMARY